MSTPIGENTPVKLGLVVLLVGLSAGALGALGGAVWWASSVSTKMDTIISNQATATATSTQQSVDIKTLEKRVASLEMVGAPPIIAKLEVLNKQVADINLKIIALEK